MKNKQILELEKRLSSEGKNKLAINDLEKKRLYLVFCPLIAFFLLASFVFLILGKYIGHPYDYIHYGLLVVFVLLIVILLFLDYRVAKKRIEIYVEERRM